MSSQSQPSSPCLRPTGTALNPPDDDRLKYLWGLSRRQQRDIDPYIWYCGDQLRRIWPPGRSVEDELRDLAPSRLRAGEATGTRAGEPGSRASNAAGGTDWEAVFEHHRQLQTENNLDTALDVTASIVLGVYVTHDPRIEPGRPKIVWEENDTLKQLIGKPLSTGKGYHSSELVAPVTLRKLRAGYFEVYARDGLSITQQICDQVREWAGDPNQRRRRFHLFDHMEAALDALIYGRLLLDGEQSTGSPPPADHEEDTDDDDDDDPIGCAERPKTLMTFRSRLPTHDRKKLEGNPIIGKSGWLPYWLQFLLTTMGMILAFYLLSRPKAAAMEHH
ncbi:hypothetical protein F5X97DRAFT_340130 [Nemania serpens]|nr:hypothetical protein F5X97DRAFT_340130 [Nemania serpens]